MALSTFKWSISEPTAVNQNNHSKRICKTPNSDNLKQQLQRWVMLVPDPGGINGKYRTEGIRGKAWRFLNGEGHKSSALHKLNLKKSIC